MFRDFQTSELRTLLNNETPSILRKNLDLDICNRTFSVINQGLWFTCISW